MIDLLTLLHKLSQLISNLLYNYLQILVAHGMKGAYRRIHSGGWSHDLRNRHNITSNACLRHKDAVSKLSPLYMTGAGVPSDHLPTGTTNTSIGCTPLNCGFSITGDFGKSAPQTAPSKAGV